MKYIHSNAVEAARQMDLLTYLQLYKPQELVQVTNNTYCIREHDSLKISKRKQDYPYDKQIKSVISTK